MASARVDLVVGVVLVAAFVGPVSPSESVPDACRRSGPSRRCHCRWTTARRPCARCPSPRALSVQVSSERSQESSTVPSPLTTPTTVGRCWTHGSCARRRPLLEDDGGRIVCELLPYWQTSRSRRRSHRRGRTSRRFRSRHRRRPRSSHIAAAPIGGERRGTPRERTRAVLKVSSVASVEVE